MTVEDVLDKIGGVVRGAGIIGKITVNSVLNSLIWIIGIFCIVLVISFITGVNDWRVVCIMVFLGFALLSVLLAFAYFAKTNPDALRSETYNLEAKKYQYELMGQKNKEISIEAIVVSDAAKNDTKAIAKGGKGNGK